MKHFIPIVTFFLIIASQAFSQQDQTVVYSVSAVWTETDLQSHLNGLKDSGYELVSILPNMPAKNFWVVAKTRLVADSIYRTLELRMETKLEEFRIEVLNSLQTIPADLKTEYKDIYEKLIEDQTSLLKLELAQIMSELAQIKEKIK